ncbi:hypothetical protein Tco_0135253 [Tanacetum coccineum]
MITGLQDDEVELMDEEFSDNEDEVAETLEFGQNPNQSNILASLSTIKPGVQNGQPVVGERMDTVIEALEDSELKNEALRNKVIMEGLISDDESYNDYRRIWKSYEINYHDYNEGEYENKTHEEGHEICGPRERKSMIIDGELKSRDLRSVGVLKTSRRLSSRIFLNKATWK